MQHYLIVLALMAILGLTLDATAMSIDQVVSNSSQFFTVTTLPSKGKLYQNLTKEVASVPASVSSLTYVASNPYEFSVISNTTNCTQPYDTFDVLQVLYPSLSNSTSTVQVCIVDKQDLPVAHDLVVFVLNETFRLIVTDEDDRAGLSDGQWSPYSFHNANGDLATGAGIKFNQTVTIFGVVTNCMGQILVPNQLYTNETFCFDADNVTNHLDEFQIVGYYAIDKAGGVSPIATIEFSFRKLLPCDSSCYVYTKENNETLVEFTLQSSAFYVIPFTYELIVDSIPLNGIVYYNDSVIVAGTKIPRGAVLQYRPNENYYNRVYFPYYANGYYSFNVSERGLNDCADALLGCPDLLTYRAINSSLSVSSEVGIIRIIVDREIIEVMQACTPYQYSPWDNEPCKSYGEMGGYIPIYLGGSDGRVTPAYKSILMSLPVYGTLFHNDASGSNVYQLGAIAKVGDLIPTLSGFYAPLLYHGNDLYFNRLRYDTSPESYISFVDEYGNYISNFCTNTTNCQDSIYFSVISDVNDTLKSPVGRYDVIVSKTVTDQLTACPSDGYSIWNYSCISFGYETNSILGTWFTPIYITSNNTRNVTYHYVITSLPGNGLLYYDATEETTLVQVNDVLSPKATGVPDFFYVGNKDYYNDVIYNGIETLLYSDLLRVPIGTCRHASTEGCPDHVGFYIQTTDGRKSNPANYAIFIHSQISNATFTGPSQFIYIPNIPFYFHDAARIIYNDPDGDIYYVAIQLTIYNGNIAIRDSMEGLTFPYINTCFNSTDGCNGYIEFVALPSRIQRVFDSMVFVCNDTLRDTDGVEFSLTVKKRLPDGMNTTDTYRNLPDDITIALDIPYYAIVAPFGDDYGGFEVYFDRQRESVECEKNNKFAISFSTVLIILFVVDIILRIYYTYLLKRMTTQTEYQAPREKTGAFANVQYNRVPGT